MIWELVQLKPWSSFSLFSPSSSSWLPSPMPRSSGWPMGLTSLSRNKVKQWSRQKSVLRTYWKQRILRPQEQSIVTIYQCVACTVPKLIGISASKPSLSRQDWMQRCWSGFLLSSNRSSAQARFYAQRFRFSFGQCALKESTVLMDALFPTSILQYSKLQLYQYFSFCRKIDALSQIFLPVGSPYSNA